MREVKTYTKKRVRGGGEINDGKIEIRDTDYI